MWKSNNKRLFNSLSQTDVSVNRAGSHYIVTQQPLKAPVIYCFLHQNMRKVIEVMLAYALERLTCFHQRPIYRLKRFLHWFQKHLFLLVCWNIILSYFSSLSDILTIVHKVDSHLRLQIQDSNEKVSQLNVLNVVYQLFLWVKT